MPNTGILRSLAVGVVLPLLSVGCGKAPPAGPTGPAPQSYASLMGLTEEQVTRQIASVHLTPYRPGESYPPHRTELARVASYPRWRRYEDEFVSFLYPQDDDLTVTVEDDGDLPAETQAGMLRSEWPEWSRCYTIRKGRTPYCILVLAQADDWDYSSCFCGLVDFETYRLSDGMIRRFLLLEDGSVKQTQIRGATRRVQLIERPHLPIHEDVYTRIALSVRIQGDPFVTKDLVKEAREWGGWSGALGLLERGMSRRDVIGLLGPPTRQEKDALVYKRPGYLTADVYRVPLQAGRFEGFGPDRWTEVRKPLERGSIAWVYITATGTPYRPGPVDDEFDEEEEIEEGPLTLMPDGSLARPETKPAPPEPVTMGNLFSHPTENAPKLPAKTATYIFDRFCALAPEAKGEGRDLLCKAAGAMGVRGQTDPRVIAILRRWVVDPETFTILPERALLACQPQAAREYFVSLIEDRMRRARRPEVADVDTVPNDLWIAHLMDLIKEHPRYVALCRSALDHPHWAIQAAGYEQWDALPRAEARRRLRAALSHRVQRIRYEAAHAFANDLGNADDLPLLKERLAAETDEVVRETLAEAVERLSTPPEP